MPLAAAVIGAGALGAGASIWAANKAADAQTAAAQQAIAAQQAMFAQSKEALNPYIQAGQGVLPTLTKLLTPGADMSATLQQIPGFQFTQQWGQKAIANQYAGRGLGGNVLKAQGDYATGAASQTYSGIIQALQGYANMGSGAAGSLAGNATATGQGIANSNIGIGNAQAGAATATGGALSGLASNFSNLAVLNALTGGKLGGPGGMYGQPADHVMGPQ